MLLLAVTRRAASFETSFDRYAHSLAGPSDPVYVLELAGEDDGFACREARVAAPDVERLAPGLALADTLDRDRVRTLAYTHRASRLLGRTEASLPAARTLLEAADLPSDGTVAVRARDVRGTTGIDTSGAERVLGTVLADDGREVDLENPAVEVRALFSADVCAIGVLEIEAERGFGDRAPTDRPFFQPGSMDTIEARAVANLAGAGLGRVVLDPMCGTGGLLLEAGLVGATILGLDAQSKMVRGTRKNLDTFLETDFAVARADATRLPLTDGRLDVVCFDAPYGRQSKIAGRDPDALLAAALGEANRVADRGCFVADRPAADLARDRGWDDVERFERRVHRSLTRHVHVLQ